VVHGRKKRTAQRSRDKKKKTQKKKGVTAPLEVHKTQRLRPDGCCERGQSTRELSLDTSECAKGQRQKKKVRRKGNSSKFET